jgi:hypothetical protein
LPALATLALSAIAIPLNDALFSRESTKGFSPYACHAVTVLCREGGSIMKAIGTYFEQVPKTVIEKILAQQGPPDEVELGSDESVKRWGASKTASKAASKTTIRNPKH